MFLYLMFTEPELKSLVQRSLTREPVYYCQENRAVKLNRSSNALLIAFFDNLQQTIKFSNVIG